MRMVDGKWRMVKRFLSRCTCHAGFGEGKQEIRRAGGTGDFLIGFHATLASLIGEQEIRRAEGTGDFLRFSRHAGFADETPGDEETRRDRRACRQPGALPRAFTNPSSIVSRAARVRESPPLSRATRGGRARGRSRRHLVSCAWPHGDSVARNRTRASPVPPDLLSPQQRRQRGAKHNQEVSCPS